MKNDDKNNEFLNEIQQKINKRSGGLYYNKKLKLIKKNLTVTSLAVIIIIILWALVNFIYQRVSLSTKIINKSPIKENIDNTKYSSSHVQLPFKKNNKKNIIQKKKEINKHSDINKSNLVGVIKKQKYRYIFTLKNKINKKTSNLIKKILKKYPKNEGKSFYIYLIPETEIKNILKLLVNMNLKLKKETYSDITNYYQISINKEILDIINKK